MALETLKGLREIDGFEIQRNILDEKRKYIYINEEENIISFQLQNGAVIHTGKNGVPVETLINTAKLIIDGLNQQVPSIRNQKAITFLLKAEEQLHLRKIERYVEIDDDYELSLS